MHEPNGDVEQEKMNLTSPEILIDPEGKVQKFLGIDRSSTLGVFLEVLTAFGLTGLVLFCIHHLLVGLSETKAGEAGIFAIEAAGVSLFIGSVMMEHLVRLVSFFVPRLKERNTNTDNSSLAKDILLIVGGSISLYVLSVLLLKFISIAFK